MVAKLKAFVMDVDGTLTDGKIYIGDKGESFKAFDVKDGYGIHEILPLHQVRPVIMTGRKSDIVANRAGELEIDIVLQGIKDKKSRQKWRLRWRWPHYFAFRRREAIMIVPAAAPIRAKAATAMIE